MESASPSSPSSLTAPASAPALFYSNAMEVQAHFPDLESTLDDHSSTHSIIPSAPTLFRRSSFTLQGERPTVLDSLVVNASTNVTVSTDSDVATTRQDSTPEISYPAVSSTSTTILSSSPIVGLNSSESSGGLRSSNTPTLFHPRSTWSSCCSGNLTTNKPSSALSTGTCVQQSFFPHTNDSDRELSSSPLSSEILRRYLAQLASDSPDESVDPYKLDYGVISEEPGDQTPRLPDCFTLSYPSITSVLIPVRQLHRAHASNQRFMRPPVKPDVNREPSSWSDHPHSVVASATSSDVEGGWTLLNPSGSHGWGYQSDGHAALDESPEVKQLQQTGRRLQASSLRRSNMNSHRSSARASTPGNRSAFSAGRTSSVHSSNFDLLHVYDGLLSTNHGSTRSLNVVHKPVYTPPPSLAMSDNGDPASVPHSVPATPGLSFSRLKTWLGQLNPTGAISMAGDDQYYYMDDKSLERRERAQASNVISPVSF